MSKGNKTGGTEKKSAKEKGGKKALAPKIEEQATKLAKPIIEKAGCQLYDVCFEKEGAMWYLRVLFDSEGGVDSDRCEEISRPINELFDKQGFIEDIDILEVGTPGVYKKIRKPEHFRAAISQRVSAHIKSDGGERYITGMLEDYDESEASITIDGEKIKLSKCIKVNYEPEELEEEDISDYEDAETQTDDCTDS